MTATVELLWIPLGAGQHVVRTSGRAFEMLSALLQRRRPCDLYHSALVVTVPTGRYVIEMTPIPDGYGVRRGVVGEGAVGSKWLGKLRHFRYEIHRWPDGVIPDAGHAVAPLIFHLGLADTYRLLASVPFVPTPVWGRDELDAGEMWNSNSVTSWILNRGGIDSARIQPPVGGRAPGWNAGAVVADRVGNSSASDRSAARTGLACGVAETPAVVICGVGVGSSAPAGPSPRE
ncbi:MAG: hypothetical protein QOH53_623 [Ilumatobacteraceae bacterium]